MNRIRRRGPGARRRRPKVKTTVPFTVRGILSRNVKSVLFVTKKSPVAIKNPSINVTILTVRNALIRGLFKTTRVLCVENM